MSSLRKKITSIAIVLLLAVCTFISLPVYPSYGEVTAVDGEVTFYEWNRVYSYSDLPGEDRGWFKAMFVFGGEGKYTCGESTYDGSEWETFHNFDEDKYMAYEDTFMTLGARGTPSLKYAGWDGAGDNDYPMYEIWFNDLSDNWAGLAIREGDNDFGFSDYASPYGVVVGTNRDTSYGYVKVFYNDSGGYDTGWYWSGGSIYGDDDWSGWDFDQFVMYVGKEKIFSAITHDFTIRSGQVLNVDDQVVLMDGVKLTVEDGGILSVEDQMYNNGIIENHGTVILQKGACLSPFDPKGQDSGQLICEGGDVVALSNSKAYFEREHGGLMLSDGATYLNSGALIIGSHLRLEDSAIENRDTGKIFSGYEFTDNIGSIRTLTVSGDATNGFDFPYLENNLNEEQKHNVYQYGMAFIGKSEICNDGYIKLGTDAIVVDSSGKISWADQVPTLITTLENN